MVTHSHVQKLCATSNVRRATLICRMPIPIANSRSGAEPLYEYEYQYENAYEYGSNVRNS